MNNQIYSERSLKNISASLNRAFLCNINKNIRIISYDWAEHSVFKIRVYTDNESTDNDKESVSVALTEFECDYEFEKWEEKILFSNEPLKNLEHHKYIIFMRNGESIYDLTELKKEVNIKIQKSQGNEGTIEPQIIDLTLAMNISLIGKIIWNFRLIGINWFKNKDFTLVIYTENNPTKLDYDLADQILLEFKELFDFRNFRKEIKQASEPQYVLGRLVRQTIYAREEFS